MSKISEIYRDLPTEKELKSLPKDGGGRWNRLVFEKSPYLLQHAKNPVDWYPWSEEAFKKAEEENKPIFLSIGYSTCHWCHVMAHESFEDQEVADLLNEHFVSIKVDREDRPDIDNIYMTITQAITGRGGWPMSVFMTSDKKVFFAGTYFPKHQRHNFPGMMQLIPALGEAWQNKKEDLVNSAEQIIASIQASLADPHKVPGSTSSIELKPPSKEEIINKHTLNVAYKQFLNQYDPEHGGFGHAPKFPCTHIFSFLLRYHKRTQDPKALEMVENTLKKIKLGGVYDQIGFGFHRYSTDNEWLLPHFEKMLYDQAMQMIAYTEAYQVTSKKEYAQVVKEIFTYVTRDMQSPEGGFYSAEDADSEGEEGKFYLWSEEEIIEILGKDQGEKFCELFNFDKEGNFLDEATHSKTGKNIPHLKNYLSEEEADFLEKNRKLLFEKREQRIHPLKDDKILTDWNGLIIAALAKVSQAFNNNAPDLQGQYLSSAIKAAEFILSKLKSKDGKLLKRYREGDTTTTSYLNDYAFLVWGLLELYEASFNIKYLEEALSLTDKMLELFWDGQNGALFLTAANNNELPIRNKEIHDGAIPSGNSIAALNLIRLAHITGNSSYQEKSEAIIHCFASQIDSYPAGYAQLLNAIDFIIGPSSEIVIVGEQDSNDSLNLIQASREGFCPNKVVLFKPSLKESADYSKNKEVEKTQKSLEQIVAHTQDHQPINNKATVYICQEQACLEPSNDSSIFNNLV